MLLFVYAALSKLLVFDEFKIQIGQSDMLTPFAGIIAWVIPYLEFLIALFLLIPRFRLLGMYAAFNLMVMFTAYIFIILNFSNDIPCSCGGVIEKLGWTEHLILNIAFVILAFIGIRIINRQKNDITRKFVSSHNTKKLYKSLFLYTIGSIGFIVILFAFTKKGTQRDTSFKRAFLYNPPKKIHDLDLEYNGYHIAGVDEKQIYLSNPRSPLYVTVVDTALQNKQNIHLTMDLDSLPFRSSQLHVIPPYFFLTDGTIPFILRGNIKDWKAYSMLEEPLYFINAQAMDSVTLAVRTMSNKTNEFALGTIRLTDSAKMTLSHKLLQKQVDGVFDVDGILQYNQERELLIYTYRYRNQFVVADDSLQLQLRGNTIDTISQAQIQVGTIASKNQQKMAAPALTVNQNSATDGNYLFVNSKLLGKAEPIEIWESSSVIDVYNLENNYYEFSFYVEDIGKNKLKAFHVLHDKFIGLIGNHMVTYQLANHFKKLQPAAITAQNKKIIDSR
ncbi:MauE/DoxX family redox-associated membrane protein [Flavivirga rizhaonensis]|uniref:Methylamine utilisation protein MauE domain-containing protein n=1 Tax=Flavivirga rizhaonensis TaxID=2559571 RepID=A0A4S1E266_9FLAO|nr:MauE/DoxX family redox-associated membrane protein [Flavivirga rizhaonensis]TGV04058.1 hypothetical protein EM932_04480 [Flavivirga rizhaonensis]